MLDVKIIEYILYFLEYLDEDTIKNFISFVFNKENYTLKPFNTYKEFLLYLLSNVTSDITYKYDISEEDLVTDKEEIVSLQEMNLLQTEKEVCRTNLYYQLKCEYEETQDISDLCLEVDDINDLLYFYNEQFIPTENSKEIILDHINCIMQAIESYLTDNYLQKNKKHCIKFVTYIINKIIEEKTCYIIDNYRHNNFKIICKKFVPNILDKTKIETTIYNVKPHQNTCKLSHNSLENIVFIENFKELYENINVNINNYRKLNTIIKRAINMQSAKNYCHICYSHIKTGKKQKCKNCQKIYTLIQEIDPEQTSNHIGGRIKQRYKDENKLSNEEKKEKHYKNLIRFVKILQKNKQNQEMLTNVNTGSNTEKFDELFRLIEKAFNDNCN